MHSVSTKIYAANVTALSNKALYHAAYGKVTDERRKKTDSFRFQRDRQLSLGAELLLMHGLKQYGLELNKIEYCYGKYGKPYLKDQPDIYFNLSHSEDIVICAVSPQEVGCDIEKIANANFSIAKKCFCENESEMLDSLKNPESKRELFFRLWTLKESFIKLTGMGMHMPMNSFYITFDTERIMVHSKFGYETCFIREMDLKHICHIQETASPKMDWTTDLWKNYKCSVCGLDKKIGAKTRVPFEILNFYDILNCCI